MTESVIVVHGGAGRWSDDRLPEAKAGIRKAVIAGYELLRSGRSSIDAVEAAVHVLEDLPEFNCGTGSYLTADGRVEMDALIMDGRTQAVGAIACATSVKHPISLARLVMEKTDHCFLVGPTLDRLAADGGLERATLEDLVTPRSRELLQKHLAKREAVAAAAETGICQDTVGAVALDVRGNLASATSTGGTTGSLPGRVGDSPLPGSGGWAENGVAAVSTTGRGEDILSDCVARRVAEGVEKGDSVKAASEAGVRHLKERLNSACGLISVGADGEVGVAVAEGQRMPWASAKAGQVVSGVAADEKARIGCDGERQACSNTRFTGHDFR